MKIYANLPMKKALAVKGSQYCLGFAQDSHDCPKGADEEWFITLPVGAFAYAPVYDGGKWAGDIKFTLRDDGEIRTDFWYAPKEDDHDYEEFDSVSEEY